MSSSCPFPRGFVILPKLSVIPSLAFLVLAITSVSGADAEPDPQNDASVDAATQVPNTPIEHVIMLMQENHSFDNYFGTYPGADGYPEDTCIPIDLSGESTTDCIEPFYIADRGITDLDHNRSAFKGQYNDGLMNGFVDYMRSVGTDYELTMGYYDDRTIPFYWNVADQYVLFDRFFSSAHGGSVWNHMYWVAGVAGNPEKDAVPDQGFGDIPTIFDRLQAAGISWKFYIQNYDPTINYRTAQTGVAPRPQVVWCPLLNYDRFLDRPELFSRIVHLDEFYTDLENGTLPAVSFIVPSGASEHPPGSIRSGQRFVKNLIVQLMRSSSWDSSAFIWSYDDWGGWYDHVKPPQIDEFGYGFRVPALMVSPYARQGYVDSTQLDYTSVLRFIEDNWDLEPLASRDANANSIISAFDFTKGPRPPVLLSEARDKPTPKKVNTLAVYILYSVAVMIPGMLVLGAAKLDRIGRKPGAS